MFGVTALGLVLLTLLALKWLQIPDSGARVRAQSQEEARVSDGPVLRSMPAQRRELPAVFDPPDVPTASPLDPPAVLQVVDRANWSSLPRAVAYRVTGRAAARFREIPSHGIPTPLNLASLREEADELGRIVVGTTDLPWVGYVWAPGYAWAKVRCGGGEQARVVPLEPGGTLDLRVLAWRSIPAATVVLRYSNGSEVPLPAPNRAGELHVDGLRCGAHELVIVRGRSYDNGEIFASAPVDIVQGVTTDLVVSAPARPRSTSAPMRGTLTVRGRWPELSHRDVVIRISGTEPKNVDGVAVIRIREDSYDHPISFKTKSLPAGLYRIEVQPFGYQREIRFDASSDVAIEIGDPLHCRIRLVVVDGHEIRSAHLLWRQVAAPEPRPGGGALNRTKFDPINQSFELLVPPGSRYLRTVVEAEGYQQLGSRVIEVGHRREHTIRMQRAAILVVRVRSGEQPVDTWIEARRAGQPGPSQNTRRGETRFANLEPGTYEVLLEDVPAGYEDPGSREVQLRVGQVTTIEFDLRAESR